MREIVVLLVHCNGIEVEKGGACVLLPTKNELNVGTNVLPS
jgi:hypothetical protein